MSGGRNTRPRKAGYTIVEVLIFMAVSGMMFTMAVVLVNGKQANSEYHQGMYDLDSQIHTVINDVANGYYPSTQDFTCRVLSPASPPSLMHSLSTVEAGTNTDCIFMGKVMHFGVQNSKGVDYNVYSVTGRRYAVGSIDTAPNSFTEAKPVAVDNGGDVNITSHKKLQWGLYVTAMYEVTYAAGSISYNPNIGAVGFFGNFGNVSGGVLQSGAQTVIAAKVPSALDQSPATIINNIQSITTAYTADKSILLCLSDGKGHTGSISIGGKNGHQLQTVVKLSGLSEVGAPC